MNNLPTVIMNEICTTLSVSKESLISKSRKRANVEARFICMFFMKKYIKNSTLEGIGNEIGLDHSSIVYGLNQVDILNQFNPLFKLKFQECEKSMQFIDPNYDYQNIAQL